MARIDDMRLWRARLSGFWRMPGPLLILLLADLAELVASIALALTAPPPATPKPMMVAFDMPVTPQKLTLGVAMIGIMAGLFMGFAILAELWVVVRRAQVFSYRYGRATLRAKTKRAAARV